MPCRFIGFLLFIVCDYSALAERASAQDFPRLAPYQAIRWKEEAPEILLDGKGYRLNAINNLPVAAIAEFAKKSYNDAWQKRFDEDLVQVLSEMGHAPGQTVKLLVRDADGKETTIDKAPLTEANHRAIMAYKSRRGPSSSPAATPTPADLRIALDEFQAALDGRWSYRRANAADFEASITSLRQSIDSGISLNDFGIELQKIIALGIDGHSYVSGYRLPSESYLPFVVEPAVQGYAAVKPTRDGFLADGFPYLIKIDGKDVSEWCAAASVLVPKGSPGYVRRGCLMQLVALDYWRGQMKLPKSDTVEVELADQEGKVRKTLTISVAKTPRRQGELSRGGSRVLEGNVGYLRLPAMDEAAVKDIKTWLPLFRDTDGLIVDVRSNGGGIRDPLRLLYSYLAAPDDPPHVFTAAAYRLHEYHLEHHLVARFMYRASGPEWTENERLAVGDFARIFKPQWQFPQSQFSDWHYMALSRLDDPGIYHYKQPAVVLLNEGCFSATDIFLAGLKGMKNVKLLGTPSGGGSARAVIVKLGPTQLQLRFGTMASFQADGRLFDGNGVSPDVLVEPTPEYYIGGSDNVLAEAVKRIKKE